MIPACCLLICYTNILCRLHTHARSLRQSHIPLRKVTVYVCGLLIFHFACWTPYWLLMLFHAAYQISPFKGDSFVYCMYFVHALPFMNSAFNWIIYAFLNTQFRKSFATVSAVNEPRRGVSLVVSLSTHNSAICRASKSTAEIQACDSMDDVML